MNAWMHGCMNGSKQTTSVLITKITFLFFVSLLEFNPPRLMETILKDLGMRPADAIVVAEVLNKKGEEWMMTNNNPFINFHQQSGIKGKMTAHTAYQGMRRWLNEKRQQQQQTTTTNESLKRKSVFAPFAQTKQPAQEFIVNTGPIYTVAFSVTQNILFAGGEGRLLHVWNTENGQHVAQILGHDGTILKICANPRADLIASCCISGPQLYIWNAITFTLEKRIVYPADTDYIEDCCFDPAGNTIASINESAIFIMACNADWPITHAIPMTNIQKCLFCTIEDKQNNSSASYLALAPYSGNLKLLDVSSGKITRTFTREQIAVDVIYQLDFSPTYGLFSRSSDGGVAQWNISTGELLQYHKTMEGFSAMSIAGCFLATTGKKAGFQIWQLPEYALINAWHIDSNFQRVFFHPHGHFFVTVHNNFQDVRFTIQLWNE